MKRIYSLILFAFFLDSSFSSAQWTHYNPGTTDLMRDVNFITEQIGYVLDQDNGMIWQTTDGAAHWHRQFNSIPMTSTIFINKDSGFAANYHGFYRTTNQGQAWD